MCTFCSDRFLRASGGYKECTRHIKVANFQGLERFEEERVGRRHSDIQFAALSWTSYNRRSGDGRGE